MAQLTIRIDDDLKGHLQNLARQEGKSTSDVVRGLVQRYVRDRDRSTALRALWDRMQNNAEEAQAGSEDIGEAIQMVREEGGSPTERPTESGGQEESRGGGPSSEARR